MLARRVADLLCSLQMQFGSTLRVAHLYRFEIIFVIIDYNEFVRLALRCQASVSGFCVVFPAFAFMFVWLFRLFSIFMMRMLNWAPDNTKRLSHLKRRSK